MSSPGESTPQDDNAVPDGSDGQRAAASAELAKLVSYAVFLATAVALYVVATGLPTSRWEPLGAGAFPRLVLALLGILCIAAMAGSARKLVRLGAPHDIGRRARTLLVANRLVVVVFVLFAAYLAVLRPLGFAIATFAFLLLAQLAIAPRRWQSLAIALAVALVFSFGLNWLFASVFTVFLPRGLLG